MENTFQFYMPNISLFGAGCVRDLGIEITKKGHKKCLIVTDKTIHKLGLPHDIAKQLTAYGLCTTLYSEVSPNPTTENVQEAFDLYCNDHCDCIISLGGGSAHDCGKAVSILATNGGTIKAYQNHPSARRGCDLFAVNTTAGTASEITTTYVITDQKAKQKMVFEDSNCLSAVAVNDPELLLTLPPSVTAATGMDAFTHALECYVSTFSALITRELALCALEVITKNIKKSVENPCNLVYREGMAVGQYIAGMAFGNGGVGITHSMAHALGGFHHIPHGLANAILLPHVVAYNSRTSGHAYEQVFHRVQQAEPSIEGDNLVEWIKNMNRHLGITQTLQQLDIPKESIPLMAISAMNDVCTATNPVIPTCAELEQIFWNAWL